jgi:hypothetical protein
MYRANTGDYFDIPEQKNMFISPIQDNFLKKNIRVPIVQFNNVNVVRLGFEWDWDNPWQIPLTFLSRYW